jgi:hypothetical protein
MWSINISPEQYHNCSPTECSVLLPALVRSTHFSTCTKYSNYIESQDGRQLLPQLFVRTVTAHYTQLFPNGHRILAAGSVDHFPNFLLRPWCFPATDNTHRSWSCSWSFSCGRQPVDQFVLVSVLPLGTITKFIFLLFFGLTITFSFSYGILSNERTGL